MARPAGYSLRHLRVFQEVARLRSVRKAADAVHLTQPAVTQAIAKLEGQIGTQLFDRRSSGTYLTPAGEILAHRVGRMFRQIEEALAALSPGDLPSAQLACAAERITLPQIRALSAIANNQVARMAEQAGISQASLIHAAREMERCLGTRLLRHASSGLSTTEEAGELARRLSIAVREFDCGLEEIWADANHHRGLLRIGVMPLAGSFLVGQVVNELIKSAPEARVQLRTADSSYLSNALLNGDIDFVIGLSRLTDGEKFTQEALAALPYVLVARAGHPLTRRSAIRLADLEDYELIAPSREATRRVAFDRLIALVPHARATNIEASSISTLRFLLSGSDRLALLTHFEFEQEKAAGVLTALPFGPIEPAPFIGVSWRKDWELPPLHKQFLSLLRSHAAAISAVEGQAPMLHCPEEAA
ncbi:LysR substrate-binding domain-containing protein [Roseomonas elaeocarpi]|uniref:LysR substrate-binding domain-containing protein n=1 Tax=Roseomonas elaeocarpi TaxID=907779 RepID=A0ABV6JWQ6_9PROT